MAFLLWAAAPLSAADTQCFSGSYQVGLHNPLYYICVPADWNGDLVVFAHGYVSPIEELVIVDYVIPPDNTPVSAIITGLGYAFATTSYSYNGLVIPQAVEDIKALVDKFPEIIGSDAPLHVYLVGASEGGLVTALALEKYPMLSGGLAACGPVGDFRKQIDYFGDFLVLFNYFFPNVLRSLTDFGETPTRNIFPKNCWSGGRPFKLQSLPRSVRIHPPQNNSCKFQKPRLIRGILIYGIDPGNTLVQHFCDQ